MDKKKLFKGILSGMAVLTAGYAVSKPIANKKAKANRKKLNIGNPHLKSRSNSYKSQNVYTRFVKDKLDGIMAYCGIVALSPVLLGISAAIYIDDPGPVLFKQKRIGKNKEYFELYKFRSMKMSTPHDVPTHMLADPDQYITKIGRILRKYSLDEIPQLLNIYEGNMSVIGPRPALWNQDDLIAERNKYYANDVKPGLTGWAQINGRDELEIPVKAKLDGEYIKAIGKSSLNAFAMDLKCFFGTVLSVLKHDGVVEGGTGEINKNIKHANISVFDNKDLKGKKILFICMSGYSDGIVKKMQDIGLDIDYMLDKPNEGAFCKTMGRLHVKLYEKILNNYYQKEINKRKSNRYDYILLIKSEYTPAKSLKLIKTTFTKSKFILYMWDSIVNNKGVESKWKFFDSVITFDRRDYLKYKDTLKFRPLFYYEDYLPDMKNGTMNYDIAFIGTGHGDRPELVKKMHKIADIDGKKIFSYLFMANKGVYMYNKVKNPFYKNVKRTDLHYEKLSTELSYLIYSMSKCVFDVEDRNQSGLTMRTIEMIGLNKKLITTNPDIVNYDFYNKDNILVVDRDNLSIDMEWIDKPYVELPFEIRNKYSLEEWIKEVLIL